MIEHKGYERDYLEKIVILGGIVCICSIGCLLYI